MRALRWGVAAGLLGVALMPAAAQAELRAGVGKADVTPRTGYYLGGWTRADRVSKGQHTRLHSRALVLRNGDRKVALVQVDLFMIPSGMVRHIGEALASRGFSERNILISASHTHSGPGGYGNYPTFNTAAPALSTAQDPSTIVGLLDPPPADRQLYTFITQQISKAIIRADRDLGPAIAGWGHGELRNLTRNRSVEAHLNDHGIVREYGQGSPSDDPEGPGHTIDPSVDVLRVDKLVRRRGSRRKRRVPIGGWSNFADHGTVTKSSFQYYNEDHHASAMKVFEDGVRDEGRVPRRQQVLNVYGNSNEGDMSAGLDYTGPAGSDTVGRIEARHMLAAWRRAGRRLGNRFPLDLRWTRTCFCGRQTKTGPAAAKPEVGLPFFTGSEEERGPLFDITHEHFEGRRSPVSSGPHGHKLGIQGIPGEVPQAVPLLAVRIGSRMLVSYPGEATKEVGARLRAEVGAAVAGSGISRIVVSGLANEFILYFTTPEEHDRQHYEGGQTLFGRSASTLINEDSAALAGRLVRGLPAPDAFPLDPTNGVRPDGPPYSSGAASGSVLEQPASVVRRFGRAAFGWQGGVQGLDRPVDRAFVLVQRRIPRRRRRPALWRTVRDDLGLEMLWTVDAEGRYRVVWESSYYAKRGLYRFVVTAKRYKLASRAFRLGTSDALSARLETPSPGTRAVRVLYPKAVKDRDITSRPPAPDGGAVRVRVGSRVVRVAQRHGSLFRFSAPAGAPVSLIAARDRHHNTARTP